MSQAAYEQIKCPSRTDQLGGPGMTARLFHYCLLALRSGSDLAMSEQIRERRHAAMPMKQHQFGERRCRRTCNIGVKKSRTRTFFPTGMKAFGLSKGHGKREEQDDCDICDETKMSEDDKTVVSGC